METPILFLSLQMYFWFSFHFVVGEEYMTKQKFMALFLLKNLTIESHFSFNKKFKMAFNRIIISSLGSPHNKSYVQIEEYFLFLNSIRTIMTVHK